MKKFLIVLVLLLVGCSKQDTKMKEYQNFYNVLKNNKVISEKVPFQITVEVSNLNEEEKMYQVIIDDTLIPLNNVSALVIHDRKTDDIFPSIGIFDDKMKLHPNVSPKGIVLVGYIPNDEIETIFKVIVNYEYNEKTYQVFYEKKI